MALDRRSPARPTTQPASGRWGLGVLGFGLGYLLRLVLTFVLAVLGLVSALFGAGPSEPDADTGTSALILGYLVVVALAALVVAAFLRSQGARRPLTAAMAGGYGGLVAGQLAGQVVGLLGLVVGAVVEITCLALLTRADPRASLRR